MGTQVRVCCGKQDMRAVDEVRSFTRVRCPSCALGRTILEKGFDFEKYYSEAYFQGNADDGYADYIASEDTVRPEFQHTLSSLTRRSRGRDSLLEFGCAYDFFLKEAAQCFREVEGIESSADEVPFSLALYQLQRITGISQRSMKALSSALPINLWDSMRVLAIK